jgi:kinesin family protein 2/24
MVLEDVSVNAEQSQTASMMAKPPGEQTGSPASKAGDTQPGDSPASKSGDTHPGDNPNFGMDKRTQRKADAKDFVAAIAKKRAELKEQPPNIKGGKAKNNVRVCVRKRPLFAYEAAKGEFDVITCVPNERAAVVVHQCNQKMVPRKGMVKRLDNLAYPCDHVFGDATDNEDVYQACGKPLLELAANGGIGTCFMFGQTGSGKTHTMSAIQHAVARDIFEVAGDKAVKLVYFELLGKSCFDLGADGHQEVRLMAGKDGAMHANGVTKLEVTDTEQLLSAVADALGRRETGSTEINATSSRSHAVCILYIGDKGKLTLVDLAGSERKEDSMYHDAERRKEGAEINASLHALKECIRFRAMKANSDGTKHVHIPYRGSNLTKVLKDSLANPKAHTTVIATAGPCATDTEHTMSTLKTVCALTCTEKGISETSDDVLTWAPPQVEGSPPAKWDNKMLAKWIGELAGGKYAAALEKFPKSMTGALFLRSSVPRLTHQLFDGDKVLAQELHTAFKSEVKSFREAEAARRKQVADDMKGRREVKSSYARSAAPTNPGS